MEWIKARKSYGSGACVELASLPWQKAKDCSHNACVEVGAYSKASACNGGQCVEAGPIIQPPENKQDATVAVRDSKNPDGPILFYDREEWAAFLDGVKKGEFDHLVNY